MKDRIEMSVTGGLGYEVRDKNMPRDSPHYLTAHLCHLDTCKRMVAASKNPREIGQLFSSSGRRMVSYSVSEEAVIKIAYENKDWVEMVAPAMHIHDIMHGKVGA